MSKTNREYLQDIIFYLEKARSFTQNGYFQFIDNEMQQLAVIRVYEVIGEIVKRIPEDFRKQNPQIDWRKLAGFRDFLSHNYDEIILDFVWQAVEDIPTLLRMLESILEDLPPDK